MAKRRVLIVEDEVLIAFELGAIVQRALDAEVLMSRSVARAKQLINQSALNDESREMDRVKVAHPSSRARNRRG
jgi:hypothetical protein